jgi:hypothetical protein
VQGARQIGAGVIRRSRSPVVAQTLRATVAATLAYAVARRLSSQPAPLTAPLTALLVVQVTLYATLKTGIRRVNAVVAGVLIAIGFSALMGLSWWSLGLIILAALTVGRFIRAGEFVSEVAISAMLVLGVAGPATQAWDRVTETLIGAAVGLAFNMLFAPPVWVEDAGVAIEELARRARRLLLDSAEALDEPASAGQAVTRLHETRRLDQAVAEVDESLRQAEDSLRLNPRVREGLLSRVILRTGLDTLEICVAVIRAMARTLTDLAKRRAPGEPLFDADVAGALEEVFANLGSAVVSFAVLVTAQASRNAEQAERRLGEALGTAWANRDIAANQLLARVQRHPLAWQLHGALLAEVDRILDELDLEHRSRRLLEELSRASLMRRQRLDRLSGLARYRELIRVPARRGDTGV